MSGPPDDASLAVIVVNYQSYDELRDCLTSLRTAGADHQVVVVDHASETAAADALATAFPEVRFLRVAANEGFAAPRRIGYSHC